VTPTLPDILPVTPFVRPALGTVVVPGSKSLTNRAMLMAALCDTPVTLKGALLSEDTEIMAEALRRLGFGVDEDESSSEIRVRGKGGRVPATDAELFTGLAGTAARFLTALCASARNGTFVVDGVPQMRTRPMKGLIDALRALGADIRCRGEEGFFPIEVRACGLRGGLVSIDARESSQMLSALLMVAPLADSAVTVVPKGKTRMPFVEMTRRQMAQFGIPYRAAASEGFTVPKGSYVSPGTYPVEPDASAASYFAALPLATGGSLSLSGLVPAGESLQGDIRFLEVLQSCGVAVAREREGITVKVPQGAEARGVDRDFSEFSDTFLTLAAVAPLLRGPTRITGIAHTRKQETDRVTGMAGELRRLGQEVLETEDCLEIHPRPLRTGQTIDTHGDHRFAMSFGVLGSHDVNGDGTPWLSIANPACCAKTFPGFFDLLDQVRIKSSGA